jgi:hypothetical protein
MMGRIAKTGRCGRAKPSPPPLPGGEEPVRWKHNGLFRLVVLLACLSLSISLIGSAGVQETESSTPKVESGEIEYYLFVPGVKGLAEYPARPDFKDWVKLKTVSFRIPGLDSPKRLMKSPPKDLRGMMAADKMEKPYFSFSWLPDENRKKDKAGKPVKPGKTDPEFILEKALKEKKPLSGWEFSMCKPDGKRFINFLFKGVQLQGISKRGEKQYVTFSFSVVVWSYYR